MDTIKLERPADGIALVTLSRPAAHNAMNTQMGEELGAVWRELAADEKVRAVVLTGEGRSFCAGADLKERDGMSDATWSAQHKIFRAMIEAQLSVPVPVIAAVNGAAMGGGGEMVVACDFALAAETAIFGWPEVKRGILPGLGAPGLLVRAVGPRLALELIAVGRTMAAQEAHQRGLVNSLHPLPDLMAAALDIAKEIAANAPLSVRAAKSVLRKGASLSTAEAMAVELAEYNTLFVTEDRREGIAAFNEKRPPRFTGR